MAILAFFEAFFVLFLKCGMREVLITIWPFFVVWHGFQNDGLSGCFKKNWNLCPFFGKIVYLQCHFWGM